MTLRERRQRRAAHTARTGLCGVTGGQEETLGANVGEEVALSVVPGTEKISISLYVGKYCFIRSELFYISTVFTVHYVMYGIMKWNMEYYLQAA